MVNSSVPKGGNRNGNQAPAAAPNTCEGQISAGVWAYISDIINRRLLVIDEQKGLSVGFSNLHHDSK